MSYPGVPEELTKEMDSCVGKMEKSGKSKTAAVALCKLSLTNRQVPEVKKKPWKTVEGKDVHYVFSSNDKINSKNDGTLIKGIEIFKAGTFKGIEFKVSAIDKMVANFHYLKEFNIFPNVPMRADHPSWMEGGKIDKVGGYVADLRRVGKKLVADVRTTSTDMLDKIVSGTYISRSAEIGGYEDNKGNFYNPILYGFAWVDIPAVEGLSPQFSFSKEDVNLVNLNETMGDTNNFPPVKEEEEVVVEPEKKEEEEVVAEEVKEETVVEPVKEELSKDTNVVEFAKAFPKEFAELEAAKEEKLTGFVKDLVKSGKITPAMEVAETEFVKSLTLEQFDKYKEIKEVSPAIVKFNDEVVEGEEPKKEEGEKEKSSDEVADEFMEETK